MCSINMLWTSVLSSMSKVVGQNENEVRDGGSKSRSDDREAVWVALESPGEEYREEWPILGILI